MKRVLILGGGFGGIAAAHRLKQNLGNEVEVILVDRRPYFMVGFRKSWALTGESPLEAGQRPLEGLSRIGVEVRRGNVDSILPLEKSAIVDGEKFEADALIIALGADLVPGAVQGFKEHAYNVYDPEDIPRAEKAVADFKGGKLVIGIFGAPYKCSPAPYEMAILLNEKFRAKGIKATVEVFSPQPKSLPILDGESCDSFESRLEGNGITFHPNHKATSIEAGKVNFENKQIEYDLLLGVPPHKAPLVVRESGLTGESGWVEIDKYTTETSFEGVYAVGDLTQVMLANKKPLPKAGLFAELMGETAAERIASVFKGETPAAKFSGEGGCYLEVGKGKAMMVKGSFLAEPEPLVSLTDSSVQYLEEKKKFESDRLEKWFGN
jgi:sulfide:quinone oxidoreductase